MHRAKNLTSRPSGIQWWFLYVGFVIYGSLVPLDFHYLPWEQALDSFRTIKLLDVGAQGRADWLSNGVLYVPVGFLSCNLIAGQRVHSLSLWHLLCSVVFSVLLAVSVEFAQLYFPPRTVSLNDLIAEFLGAIIGAGLAFRWAYRFRSLLTALKGVGIDRLLTHLLEFYAFLYIAFSIFPFDFIVSGDEFEWKLHSDSWAWLIAKDFASGSIVISIAKLMAEVLAVIPLGMLLARLRTEATHGDKLHAFKAGAGLGLTIEIIQFFLFSGLSQGLSIVTRAVGMFMGALIWRLRGRIDAAHSAAALRQHAVILTLAYLIALIMVNGWHDRHWTNLESAIRVFSETRFLLFYYHYYTTEQAALLSLAAVALTYVPVGVLVWSTQKLSSRIAFMIAALLAFGIEVSKLFLEGLHPDPTNMLIAGFSAWGAAKLAELLSTPLDGNEAGKLVTSSVPDEIHHGLPRTPKRQYLELGSTLMPLSPARITVLAGSMLPVIWAVATFPVFSVSLGIFMTGYAILLWYRPHASLVVVPAAIALLDLAPWSGRFFIDEFDMLLWVTIAIGYLRTKRASGTSKLDGLFASALILMGISYLISAGLGLFPLRALDANSLAHYYSPFNALRVAKGALWAFLLYGLFARFMSSGHNVPRLFAIGMAGGLAGTVLIIFWERLIFPGIFNFSDVYRVTGPFSQMHVGGADIETYLTVGVPFLVMLLIGKVSNWVRVACVLILLGTTYGVMVTFSRVGYAGFGVALMLALVLATTKSVGDQPFAFLKRRSLSLVLILAILGIAIPIFYSQFAQERMALVGSDLEARQRHWHDALKIRDAGWLTALFGMGVGRYPETHFWRSDETRAAPYWLVSEEEKHFLRLGAGNLLYVEQFVSIQPGNEYSVEFNGRSNKQNAQITVSICEKWLLTSARCSSEVVRIKGDGTWQPMQVRLSSGEVGQGPWYLGRPVKFSVYNTSPMATVDLGNIRMTGDSGYDLLANGDFSHGLNRWFFTVDNDLPWHIWSMPIQILFDQGWLGVIALGLFMLLGLWRAGHQALRGNYTAGVLLAAQTGFVVIGTLDSLVDSPRILMLCLLNCWMCWNIKQKSPPERGVKVLQPKN